MSLRSNPRPDPSRELTLTPSSGRGPTAFTNLVRGQGELPNMASGTEPSSTLSGPSITARGTSNHSSGGNLDFRRPGLDRVRSFDSVSSSWVSIPSHPSNGSVSSLSLSDEGDSDLNAMGISTLRRSRRDVRRRHPHRTGPRTDVPESLSHRRNTMDCVPTHSLPNNSDQNEGHVPRAQGANGIGATAALSFAAGVFSASTSTSSSSSAFQSPLRLSPREPPSRASVESSEQFQLPLPAVPSMSELRPPRFDLNGGPLPDNEDTTAGYERSESEGSLLQLPESMSHSVSGIDTDADTDADRETETDGEMDLAAFVPPPHIFSNLDTNTICERRVELPGCEYFTSPSTDDPVFYARRSENSHSERFGSSSVAAGSKNGQSAPSARSGFGLGYGGVRFNRQLSERRRASQVERSNEVLRASLTTLLSCAAAARGSNARGGGCRNQMEFQSSSDDGAASKLSSDDSKPHSKGKQRVDDPTASPGTEEEQYANTFDPVSLRLLSESAILGESTRTGPSNKRQTRPAVTLWAQSQQDQSESSSCRSEALSCSREECSRCRSPRSSRVKSNPTSKEEVDSSSSSKLLSLRIPRSAIPYILSLSVLVAVGALSFSAGYLLGRIPTGAAALETGAAASLTSSPSAPAAAAAGGSFHLIDDANSFLSGWPMASGGSGAEVMDAVDELVEGMYSALDAESLIPTAVGEEILSAVGAGVDKMRFEHVMWPLKLSREAAESVAAAAAEEAATSAAAAAATASAEAASSVSLGLVSDAGATKAGGALGSIEKVLAVGGVFGSMIGGKSLLADW